MPLHIVPVAATYSAGCRYIVPVVATYSAGIVGWRIHTGTIEEPLLQYRGLARPHYSLFRSLNLGPQLNMVTTNTGWLKMNDVNIGKA